jgi:hypothetical protein
MEWFTELAMPSPPHTYVEHVFTVDNEDGTVAYVIELDGTKYPPAGSYPDAHEAWKGGQAEMLRLKEVRGLGGPDETVQRLIERLQRE